MTESKLEEDIVAVITENLKKKYTVQVDGLGSFSVKHQTQVQKQEKDGRIVLLPPANVVVFTPEDQEGT